MTSSPWDTAAPLRFPGFSKIESRPGISHNVLAVHNSLQAARLKHLVGNRQLGLDDKTIDAYREKLSAMANRSRTPDTASRTNWKTAHSEVLFDRSFIGEGLILEVAGGEGVTATDRLPGGLTSWPG